MKEIPLVGGKFSQVDDEDYEWLMKYKWHEIQDENRNTIGAGRFDMKTKTVIMMHDAIMDHTRRNSRKFQA